MSRTSSLTPPFFELALVFCKDQVIYQATNLNTTFFLIMAWLHLLLKLLVDTTSSPYTFFSSLTLLALGFLLCFLYFNSRSRPIYLVDFACLKSPVGSRAPIATWIEHAHIFYRNNPKVADFCTRILLKSGIGDETAIPPAVYYLPPNRSRKLADEEARFVIFSVLDSLFAKTGVSPGEINVLVVNCNVYCPIPSLTSMVVNRYRRQLLNLYITTSS